MVAYENGKIPPDLLRRVSNFRPLYASVNSNVGSDLLREDAWAALNMLQQAFLKGFERPLNVSEAYRGLNRQTAVWQQYINGDGPMAARPGTSNHGWGISVDFGSDVNTYGSATKYWMDRNAPRWGWHPVGNSFGKPEAWHFEFKPNTATETIPASSGATPFPTTDPEPESKDEDMPTYELAKLKGTSTVFFAVDRIQRKAVTAAELPDYVDFIRVHGQDFAIKEVGSISSFGVDISKRPEKLLIKSPSNDTVYLSVDRLFRIPVTAVALPAYQWWLANDGYDNTIKVDANLDAFGAVL